MATLPLKIKPFIVPDSVTLDLPPGRKQDGFTALPQISLDNIPKEVLEEMCEAFKTSILEKAGYGDKLGQRLPPTRGISC